MEELETDELEETVEDAELFEELSDIAIRIFRNVDREVASWCRASRRKRDYHPHLYGCIVNDLADLHDLQRHHKLIAKLNRLSVAKVNIVIASYVESAAGGLKTNGSFNFGGIPNMKVAHGSEFTGSMKDWKESFELVGSSMKNGEVTILCVCSC